RQLSCLAASSLTEDHNYRITAPTLVMGGDHDVLIPACYARQMAREIAGSEFVQISGCGHNPFTEQPEAVLPRITQFLLRSRGYRDEDEPSEKWHDLQPVLEEAV